MNDPFIATPMPPEAVLPPVEDDWRYICETRIGRLELAKIRCSKLLGRIEAARDDLMDFVRDCNAAGV